jgi:hypothetical protein
MHKRKNDRSPAQDETVRSRVGASGMLALAVCCGLVGACSSGGGPTSHAQRPVSITGGGLEEVPRVPARAAAADGSAPVEHTHPDGRLSRRAEM